MPTLAELLNAPDPYGRPGSSSLDATMNRNFAALASAGVPVTFEPAPNSYDVGQRYGPSVDEASAVAEQKRLEAMIETYRRSDLPQRGITLQQFMGSVGGQEQRSDRMSELAMKRDLELLGIRQRGEEAQASRELRSAVQEQNAALRQQGLNIQASNAAAAKAAKEATLAEQQESRRNKEVNSLGGAVTRAGLGEQSAVLQGLENILATKPELASYVSGTDSWKPDYFIPQEAKEFRQAAQKLFNITLKNRSGAAVTVPEFERLKQEFATGLWKTPDQLLTGVKQARTIIDKHYKSISAGYSKEARDQFEANWAETGAPPIGMSGAPAPAGANGEWWVRKKKK